MARRKIALATKTEKGREPPGSRISRDVLSAQRALISDVSLSSGQSTIFRDKAPDALQSPPGSAPNNSADLDREPRPFASRNGRPKARRLGSTNRRSAAADLEQRTVRV